MSKEFRVPAFEKLQAQLGGDEGGGGKANMPLKLAKQFLAGKGKRTSATLVGLHKGLGNPALVAKVIEAHRKGAKLGADVGEKDDLFALVQNPKFDFGDKKGEKKEQPGGGKD